MSTNMTKTALIAAMAEKTELTRKDVGSVLDALVDVMSSEIAAGRAVTIPGAVKVACKDRPERTVRNPSTGESMIKAADRTVKATVMKALKDAALA